MKGFQCHFIIDVVVTLLLILKWYLYSGVVLYTLKVIERQARRYWSLNELGNSVANFNHVFVCHVYSSLCVTIF